MLVVEALTIVVAPSVEAYIVLEPLQVGAAHGLHLRVGMIPIACKAVVRLVAVAVIRLRVCTFSAAGVVAPHLVGGSEPRAIRVECSVFAEVHRCKATPTAATVIVVDDNISYGSSVLLLEFADERTQLGLVAPGTTVDITIVLWVIACTVAVRNGR